MYGLTMWLLCVFFLLSFNMWSVLLLLFSKDNGNNNNWCKDGGGKYKVLNKLVSLSLLWVLCRFRVLAVDHDLLSFVDARLGDWPLILVTNPKDAQFLAPHHEPTESIKHSTHIRSVVTHSFSTPQSGPTVIMSVMHCTQSQYSTVRAHSHNVSNTPHTSGQWSYTVSVLHSQGPQS